MSLGNDFAAVNAGSVTVVPAVRARDLFADNLNDVVSPNATVEAVQPDMGNMFESIFASAAGLLSRDEQNLNQALKGNPDQDKQQQPLTPDQLAVANDKIKVDNVTPMTASKAGSIDTNAADKHKAASNVAQSTDTKLLAMQDLRAQFQMTAEAMANGTMPKDEKPAADQSKEPATVGDALRSAAVGVATGGITGGLTSAVMGPVVGSAIGVATAFKDIAGLASAMKGQGTDGQPNAAPVYNVAKTRAEAERMRMEATAGGGESAAFRPNGGGGTMAAVAPAEKKPDIGDINGVKDSVASMRDMGKTPLVLTPQMQAIQDSMDRKEEMLLAQNQNAHGVKEEMENRRDKGVSIGIDEAYRAVDKGINVQLAGTQGLRTAPGQFA